MDKYIRSDQYALLNSYTILAKSLLDQIELHSSYYDHITSVSRLDFSISPADRGTKVINSF